MKRIMKKKIRQAVFAVIINHTAYIVVRHIKLKVKKKD